MECIQTVPDHITKMESIHSTIDGTNLAAGTNTLNGVAVVPGKIQKITNFSYSYTGTVTNVRVEVKAGGKTILKTDANPVSGQVEEWNGEVYLKAGEYISVVITNATLNDDFTMDLNGVESLAE